MIYKKTIQVIFFVTCIICNLHSQSNIDTLLQNNDLSTLNKVIDGVKIIESETELPLEAKNNDLIILEDEYEIKSLFEFYDGQWNDKSHPIIAKILKNDRGTTYKNLFNYKVNAQEFNPYESDNFKYEESSLSIIVIKILNSINNEKQMNQTLANFLKDNSIKTEQILNIQLKDLDKPSCKIVIIYKN